MGSVKLSKGYGIHIIELYLPNLKYAEAHKVIDRLVDYGEIWKIKSNLYNIDRHFKSQYFVEDGVRMRIHQSHNHSNGTGFAINPSTFLSGKYQPVKLWVPTPEAVDELLDVLLSNEIEATEKKQVLQDGFGIPMTRELEGGLQDMYNLGEAIARENMAKGRAEGRSEGLRNVRYLISEIL